MAGVIYITYATTHNIVLGFVNLIIAEILYGCLTAIIVKRFIPQLDMWLFGKNIFKVLVVIAISGILAYILHCTLTLSLLNIIATTALYVVLFIPLAYFFTFNKEERIKLREIVRNKILYYKK